VISGADYQCANGIHPMLSHGTVVMGMHIIVQYWGKFSFEEQPTNKICGKNTLYYGLNFVLDPQQLFRFSQMTQLFLLFFRFIEWTGTGALQLLHQRIASVRDCLAKDRDKKEYFIAQYYGWKLFQIYEQRY
jgi:hypothetical protein